MNIWHYFDPKFLVYRSVLFRNWSFILFRRGKNFTLRYNLFCKHMFPFLLSIEEFWLKYHCRVFQIVNMLEGSQNMSCTVLFSRFDQFRVRSFRACNEMKVSLENFLFLFSLIGFFRIDKVHRDWNLIRSSRVRWGNSSLFTS